MYIQVYTVHLYLYIYIYIYIYTPIPIGIGAGIGIGRYALYIGPVSIESISDIAQIRCSYSGRIRRARVCVHHRRESSRY